MITKKTLLELKRITDAKHQSAIADLKVTQHVMHQLSEKEGKIRDINLSERAQKESNPASIMAEAKWQAALGTRRKAIQSDKDKVQVTLDQKLEVARNTHGRKEAVQHLEKKYLK